MEITTQIIIGFIALLHLYFLWLEMFAWTTRAPKVFRGYSKEYFEQSKVLAANQGLYNGFLAAGLIWSFFIIDPEWQFNIRCFFLGCIAVAGLYGAYTASKKILYIQAFPALLALSLLIAMA